MTVIQPIRLDGRLVAAVIADHAIIADHLRADQQRIVDAMCIYAIDIPAGERSGPYSDRDAERHALQLTSASRHRNGPR